MMPPMCTSKPKVVEKAEKTRVEGPATAGLAVRRWLPVRLEPLVSLPQHADQHRPKRPVLLAVDQEVAKERLSG